MALRGSNSKSIEKAGFVAKTSETPTLCLPGTRIQDGTALTASGALSASRDRVVCEFDHPHIKSAWSCQTEILSLFCNDRAMV